MSTEEVNLLATEALQEFIFTHENDDEAKLLLMHRSILGIPAKLVIQQISARRKARTKLPSYYKTLGVIYPPSINLEQSSSETTAKFKSEILKREIGETISGVDLTGGFGVDSFFLRQITSDLTYVEPANDLIQIVRHNHNLWRGKKIFYQNDTAENFLKNSSGQFSFIFLDPSRRDAKSRKVFSLADCSPNITELLPLLLERTNFIFLKASPLLDIKQGLRELEGVKKVEVVSVLNECKELLFLIQKGFSGEPQIETYNLNSDSSIKHSFHFSFKEEDSALSQFSPPEKYVYEPNASILKSGAFKMVGEKFRIKKIHVNTHLYTSNALIENFPGRIFEIEESLGKKSGLNEANVISRNYPLTSEELRKKLKLKEGGEKFVLAFSGIDKKYLVLAKRLA